MNLHSGHWGQKTAEVTVNVFVNSLNCCYQPKTDLTLKTLGVLIVMPDYCTDSGNVGCSTNSVAAIDL